MNDVDYHELVRQALGAGQHKMPKHKKVLAFLKVVYSDEEAKLVTLFDPIGKTNTAQEIADRAGMEVAKVEEMLNWMADKGTIINPGDKFGLIPLVPGVFELYYLKHNDSEENLKKAAIIWNDIVHKIFPSVELSSEQPTFRPKLPLGAKKNLIKIDESVDAASEVLPYELVEEMIEQNDYFAKAPCQCRMVGDYAGNPCKVAPEDVGCFAVGDMARLAVASGVATEMTKEEAIDYLKRASEAGLVHNGGNNSGPMSNAAICNCCTCHCPSVRAEATYRIKGVERSNFLPDFDNDLCNKCETCIRKCPVNAIFHHWPVETDGSDEKIFIKEDFCIGCGICAMNCPEEAIKMDRVRSNVPPEKSPLIEALGM